MRNAIIELKALGKLVIFLAKILGALWVAQQLIWMAWALAG